MKVSTIRNRRLDEANDWQDSAAAKHVMHKPMNSTPASEKSFELVKKWIHSCDKHYQDTSPQRYPLPSRVIDVGTQDHPDLHLRRTDSSDAQPYLCLSYCWGGDQHMRLTKGTLRSWLSTYKKSFERLPKTLQDAIAVTRQLGYRYLWIDSLCIVQDDLHDIEQEITRMPSYYQGAAFTILASRAANCMDGFLQPRSDGPDSSHEYIFPMKFKVPESKTTVEKVETVHIVIYTALSNDSMTKQIRFLPLGYNIATESTQSRGWILQEELLSSRILDYGTQYTHWKCSEHSSCQGKQDGGDDPEMRMWTPPLLSDTKNIDSTVNLLYPSLSGAEVAWFYTVEEFTNRLTTLRKDRVYAIAGIAEQYSQHIDCRYLSGIWMSSLPYALLWRIESRSDRRPRSWDYPAPTWSWMSVHGSVRYKLPVGEDMKPMVKLFSANMNLTLESAKYGGTQDSHIVIGGWPYHAMLTNRSSSLTKYDRALLGKPLEEGCVISKKFWLDTSDIKGVMHENIEVWLLPVLKNKAKSKDFQVCGLILSHRGPLNQYQREGYFEYWQNCSSVGVELFRESPVQVISIY